MDDTQYAVRQDKLKQLNTQLKQEFFGIDPVIDKTTDAIYAWYVFPEVILRPVVVNLWGMTGVGKTHLVRRISQILGLQDHFVELQMDTDNTNAGWGGGSSVAVALMNSNIAEGESGILLLDEFQRFRTIEQNGMESKSTRYNDVWQLLSDGKFAAKTTIYTEIQDMLCDMLWEDSREEPKSVDEPQNAPRKPKPFKMSPWEARRLKTLLRLNDSVADIMNWGPEQVKHTLNSALSQRDSWEISYNKLLIFISGNLDEAFSLADRVTDCDTDADIFHELTKQITVSDIKDALKQRLRAEQIARLGNTHVIYPSLPRSAYMDLIKATCSRYLKDMQEATGVKFQLASGAHQEIYDNSVYPAQGTRPVFSAVHQIFGSALSRVAVWALEQHVPVVSLKLDAAHQTMQATEVLGFLEGDREGGRSTEVPMPLPLRTLRAHASKDFKTLVAVHEAGHALVYSILTHRVPLELKINLASFLGGYTIRDDVKNSAESANFLAHQMITYYAGTAAEELVFGVRGDGCGSDVTRATMMASNMVRRLGLAGCLAYVGGETENPTCSTDLPTSNISITSMCQASYEQAHQLLSRYSDLLVMLTDRVLEEETLSQERLYECLAPYLELNMESGDTTEAYEDSYTRFKATVPELVPVGISDPC